jgi:hypothetical protein
MSYCKFEGCNKHGIFGIQTDKFYCKNHKSEGMVDLRNKKCEFEGCIKNPLFNFKGYSKKYCNLHKLEGMVNVVHRNCIHAGCTKQASFNFKDKLADYCEQHKKDEMIFVIKKNKCKNIGCDVRPSFNYPNNKGSLYCSYHKLEGMIDINRKCEIIDCKTNCRYNYDTEKKARFCTKHKLDGMVDILSVRCKTPLCDTRVTKKYEGFCFRCFMYNFPDKTIIKNYKTKEKSVCDFIKLNFPQFDFILDKKIPNGCSNRRPDILLDLGYQIIIIEVDENQHLDYDSTCENKRLMELSQDLGHRPIIFIRFNPDEYTNKEKKISSCWGINNKGFCVIKKKKRIEWNNRLKVLKTHLDYWTNPENESNKTLEIIYLYYNESDT